MLPEHHRWKQNNISMATVLANKMVEMVNKYGA